MPKPGFASLTIGDVIYDMWFDFFKSRRHNFQIIGIHSMSGLITVILDSVSKQNGAKLTEIIQMEKDDLG